MTLAQLIKKLTEFGQEEKLGDVNVIVDGFGEKVEIENIEKGYSQQDDGFKETVCIIMLKRMEQKK